MLGRLPALQADAELLVQLRKQIGARQELVRQWCQVRSPIPPLTVEMLQGLSGTPLGLVTGSERAEVEPILREAGVLSYFGALVLGEDCARPKPSPEPYMLVRRQLGIDGKPLRIPTPAWRVPGLRDSEWSGWMNRAQRLAEIVSGALRTK